MKRFYARLLMLATAVILSACAGLLGPREVEFSQDKLQQSLARHFPLNKRYLALFDIDVSNPTLTLQPQSNRILTTMDASIAPPFAKNAWKGRFAISGGLRFDPARNAIVLTDPRMESIELDGVDAAVSRQVSKLGRVLAEEILNGATLYALQPNDLRYAGSRFVPGNIVVKSNSLLVALEPVK
ncbi:DUF1439 domain-containing protein [Herminiimonas sp. CN]|uniref:DUF1439 domain-containing protein n=1 Tax=Herminiimonas sp. CN TaxID=1349818 RepID=UPI0004739538|nr:DUF1439 domain-containing protein [Herminiimonas sp. CN]